MSRRIAIATITMARNDAEAAEISTALAELAKCGFPVFVADRSTHADFKTFLARSNFTILEGATDLVSQARLALNAAAQSADEILYTEPDKKFFFEHALRDFVTGAKPNALLLPARSVKSFATYSRIQQRVETAVNLLCGEMVGVPGDFTYGPMLFPVSLVREFENYPAHFGWGWRLHIVRAAARSAIPVEVHEIDLPCPETQRAETPEEWAHRMRQYTQNVGALLFNALPDEIARVSRLAPVMEESLR